MRWLVLWLLLSAVHVLVWLAVQRLAPGSAGSAGSAASLWPAAEDLVHFLVIPPAEVAALALVAWTRRHRE